MSNSSMKPEIVVLRLNSLDQEEIHRNAEKKTIHYVVKVLPFTIELALRNHDPYVIDFHKFTLQSTLLYDTHDERAVDWVKSSPIECVVQVNETGERAKAEVRLTVLSSQHEDLPFRIKFTANPPAAQASELQPVYGVTDPIKVVSKQSQLPKNKKPPAVRGTKRQRSTPATSTPPSVSAVSTPITTSADGGEAQDQAQARLVQHLARIEAQQRQQQDLINSLIQTVTSLQQVGSPAHHMMMHQPSASPAVADVGSPQSLRDEEEEEGPRRKRSRIEDQLDETTVSDAAQQFERHLSGLLATFTQLAPQERASTIHRVFRDHSAHASEVVEALLAESLTPKHEAEDNLDLATADLSHFEPLTYDHVPISRVRNPAMPSAEVERPTLLTPFSQAARRPAISYDRPNEPEYVDS